MPKCVMLMLILAACVGDAGPAGLTGPVGARGLAGPIGPMGAPGAPGKDAPQGAYRPLFWTRCLALLDLIGTNGARDGVTETSLDYAALLYSNRDLEVQCTAAIGSAQEGGQSSYYPAKVTNGASDGRCVASAEYEDGGPGKSAGGWFFELVARSGPRATYKDSDNPFGLDGFVRVFTSDECAAYEMSTDGEWTTVPLSAVF